jgi:hypothetical protein
MRHREMVYPRVRTFFENGDDMVRPEHAKRPDHQRGPEAHAASCRQLCQPGDHVFLHHVVAPRRVVGEKRRPRRALGEEDLRQEALARRLGRGRATSDVYVSRRGWLFGLRQRDALAVGLRRVSTRFAASAPLGHLRASRSTEDKCKKGKEPKLSSRACPSHVLPTSQRREGSCLVQSAPLLPKRGTARAFPALE